MELQDLKDKLNIVNDENNPIGITIHLVKKNEDSTESILDADISTDLAVELKYVFKEAINEKILNNEELDLKNISSTYETFNSIFLYDLEEFPQKLSIINEFQAFHNYPNFSFSNHELESIKGIIITIGNEENYFSIYKHVYPITIVRQDKMLGLIPRGNRFEKLDSNILQINSSIDFLFTDESLIVNNLKTFAGAYGYNEVVKNQARSKIELISTLDLIDNIEELTNFIENVKYAKRVLRIQPNSPVLQLAKTRIIAFIANHPKLSRKIRLNEAGDKISLDTDISKVIAIGILNDDFLKSNLTDLDYESENKLTINDE
ncbi:anti-phage protein KwaB [uncultured Chryseobacterium sp.]|uniref:anti-phage protein KwaB n=1 Tax=uncultured Chryseobacterium sp. TaxID=259322 RepID=UPI002589535B|nr:anti-phage protein KwaB [uncultured Chryseobacterium sp.]